MGFYYFKISRRQDIGLANIITRHNTALQPEPVPVLELLSFSIVISFLYLIWVSFERNT